MLEFFNNTCPIFSGLTTGAKLIGCKVEELKLALSTRKMRVGRRNDTIVQKLTLAQVGQFVSNYFILKMSRRCGLLTFIHDKPPDFYCSTCIDISGHGYKGCVSKIDLFLFV